jgi:hypothetical protein
MRLISAYERASADIKRASADIKRVDGFQVVFFSQDNQGTFLFYFIYRHKLKNY